MDLQIAVAKGVFDTAAYPLVVPIVINGGEYCMMSEELFRKLCGEKRVPYEHVVFGESEYEGVSVATVPQPVAPPSPELVERYVARCMATVKDGKARLEEEIRKKEQKIAEYEGHIVEAMREKELAEARLRGFDITIEERRAEFAKEFRTILECPDIEGLEISGTVFVVKTRMILVEHKGEQYEIGKFSIQFDTAGRGRPSFHNTTRQIDGFHHPHVMSPTEPCLGNVSAMYAETLGAHQYAAAIMILISFLHSYNAEENGGRGPWNRRIEDTWPKIPPKVAPVSVATGAKVPEQEKEAVAA